MFLFVEGEDYPCRQCQIHPRVEVAVHDNQPDTIISNLEIDFGHRIVI